MSNTDDAKVEQCFNTFVILVHRRIRSTKQFRLKTSNLKPEWELPHHNHILGPEMQNRPKSGDQDKDDNLWSPDQDHDLENTSHQSGAVNAVISQQQE